VWRNKKEPRMETLLKPPFGKRSRSERFPQGGLKRDPVRAAFFVFLLAMNKLLGFIHSEEDKLLSFFASWACLEEFMPASSGGTFSSTHRSVTPHNSRY
jgi:hypothetical protein